MLPVERSRFVYHLAVWSREFFGECSNARSRQGYELKMMRRQSGKRIVLLVSVLILSEITLMGVPSYWQRPQSLPLFFQHKNIYTRSNNSNKTDNHCSNSSGSARGSVLDFKLLNGVMFYTRWDQYTFSRVIYPCLIIMSSHLDVFGGVPKIIYSDFSTFN